MAPSVDMDIDLSIQMEKKKRKKSKDLSASVEHVEDSDDSKKKKKKNNKESGSVKEGDKSTLIQLVAKYLEKRNLSKTLSSFLSETQCENSWKTQTIDLEDIFNQYSNQDSEKLKKYDVKIINSHVNEDSNSKLQEQELKTKNAGSLKSQASGSDGSDSSSDGSEDEVAVKKNKHNKEPEKDCYTDSEKLPKQTNSGKRGNLLQESLEVMKEEKKKRKKIPKDKDLMDSDEQKTCFDQECRNSCKDNSKPSKAKRKQKDSENLGESLQELLEAPKEEKKKKKKKKIEDKDGHKTSAIEENRNPIKDESKSSKTLLKQIDSGKVDESFEKEKKRKKNKNFDKCFINNDENGNSISDNSTPSKASKESKNVLGLYEPLQESLKVAKDKKKKEEDAKGKNTGNNGKENDVEKTKKEKFNKLETSGSNVINEESTTKNLKDLTEDTDNLLCDITPLNKKAKTDERNISVSSNSKKNSIEPTTAKAFQRVKLEEVKFVDPRLKDNSYWAKSGAEVGYGAKAEQVLGQVRGKDFRHEKTKKKRGSYTGGMIDLQSHSIKFSYSDEE